MNYGVLFDFARDHNIDYNKLCAAVHTALNVGDTPIDMILHCPKCHTQHIDYHETDTEYTDRLHESPWWELGGDKPARWTNPPHRSHKCFSCGNIWRPADVFTNGVPSIKTRGKVDSE